MPAAKIDALFKAAHKLHEQGRLAEAERLYLVVLKARPRDFDLLNGLANIALQSSRMDVAVERLQTALAVRPDVFITRYNLGTALRHFGRFEEALTEYDAAIALDSADAMWCAIAWTNRGEVLRQLKRLDDAIESSDRALSFQKDFAQAWHIRGNALYDLGQWRAAVESLERALTLRPDYPKAWSNLGNAFRQLGRFDDAITSYDRALELHPNFAESLNNLADTLINRGVALDELARFDEALADYDRAIALDPRYLDANFNQSLTRLLLADFGGGWPLYELRKLKDIPVANRAYPLPLWSGEEDPQGKTILIHAEQGLGDTIQFCRYLPMLEALGLKVLFAPQLLLCALMRTLSPSVEIVDADDPALRFDYHSPLMSLPLAFGTRLETIPAAVPYLAADPDRIVRWRRRIGSGGLRIGVCWRGSRTLQGRDFSPDLLRPLAAAPGVRLIRLQNDDDAAFDAHPGLEIERLEGLDAGPDAFLDTAAVMESLDLVITCDTAIAHLAGALGRPTWVALKHVPDWRWLLDRTDSPWYPTLRLFRQKTRGDWGPVFEEMAEALRQRLAAPAPGSSLPPS